MLQECIDNRLGIFARIISHLVHPLGEPSINPGCRISRFLVALPLMRDLLLSAKHLFVAAMVAVALAKLPVSMADLLMEEVLNCHDAPGARGVL
jgi:hypothetical protein